MEKIIEKVVDNPVEKIIYQVLRFKLLRQTLPQTNRATAGSREAHIPGLCPVRFP